MPDQVPPVTGEALLHWARELIEELARGGHADLHTLEDYLPEQHVALAEVVSAALRDRRPRVRRAAAWVVGETHVMPEDAVPLLARLLRDRVALVRMAAAWALGKLGPDAAETVPSLVAAIDDANGGVRFAAVCGVRGIGLAAAAAVPPLLAIANKASAGDLGIAALKTLAEIAPDHPAVRELLLKALTGPTRSSGRPPLPASPAPWNRPPRPPPCWRPAWSPPIPPS